VNEPLAGVISRSGASGWSPAPSTKARQKPSSLEKTKETEMTVTEFRQTAKSVRDVLTKYDDLILNLTPFKETVWEDERMLFDLIEHSVRELQDIQTQLLRESK
jgi:hypothetical protein